MIRRISKGDKTAMRQLENRFMTNRSSYDDGKRIKFDDLKIQATLVLKGRKVNKVK